MATLKDFLANHPKVAGNFNKLNPAQQQQFKQTYQSGNQQGAIQGMRGILGINPKQRPGDGQGVGPGDVPNPARGYNMQQMKGVTGAATEANQYALNQNLAANRFNQVNPYGQQTWSQNADGSWTQNTSLSAPQQQMLQQQQSFETGAGQLKNTQLGQAAQQGAFNYSGAMLPTDANAYSADRQKAQQAAYDSFAQMNEPAMAKQEESFRQRMADQGIAEGSKDWADRYQMEVTNPQAQTRQQWTNQAFQAGSQQQQADIGANLNINQQGYGQAAQTYQMPYQTMGALSGMQQGVVNPQYQQAYTGEMQAPDVAGIASTWKTGKTARQVADIQGQTARDVAGINKSAALEAAAIAAESKDEGDNFDGVMRNGQNVSAIPKKAQVNTRVARRRGGILRANPR